MELDTDVIIIGAGVSGLGLAVQLIRKYGHRRFELIEKTSHIGGTWWTNSYPGCGVDVVAHFYSYSFHLNPNWSRKYPLQPEILEYLDDVADTYDIKKHTKFRSIVTSARWDASSGTWLVMIKNLATEDTYERRCKILVSAVGILSEPNGCPIPGESSFQGRMFHTAEWDHTFDWKDKDIVVIGNGCSASQVLPTITAPPHAARKATQFARDAQWVFERPNPAYSRAFQLALAWVPFALRAYRLTQQYKTEWDFQSFPRHTATGAAIRSAYAAYQGAYIRRSAPERYHGFLVPGTEVGCKRRVMDSGYLECLHRENAELVHDDPVEEVVAEGVRTRSGRVVRADAIVLANGFRVLGPLVSLDVRGEDGVSIAEHWDELSNGSASAYFGTCLSKFPNFFIITGPNTASGHGSVLYTSECQINFILRLIKPVMNALRAQRSILPVLGTKADIVKVTPEAEKTDIETVQERLKGMIWASGCSSWALDQTGRNTTMYPDFQYKYWLRSVFVAWRDFDLSTSKPVAAALASNSFGVGSWLTLSTAVAVAGYFAHQRFPLNRFR